MQSRHHPQIRSGELVVIGGLNQQAAADALEIAGGDAFAERHFEQAQVPAWGADQQVGNAKSDLCERLQLVASREEAITAESTLMEDVLYRGLRKRLGQFDGVPGASARSASAIA